MNKQHHFRHCFQRAHKDLIQTIQTAVYSYRDFRFINVNYYYYYYYCSL